VRRKDERGFNDGYHLQHGEEAKALVELLNRLERERDEVTKDLEFRRELYKVQEEYLETARRERDEAREQNAKLRDIAGGLAAALERLDALYRSEQDPEAPMPRPDWLRRPLQMLDAELARRARNE
jgi:chromosome segregation ATPase